VRHAARWRGVQIAWRPARIAFRFATAGFAERLERILISRPDESAQLLNGKIRREILLGYEMHRSLRYLVLQRRMTAESRPIIGTSTAITDAATDEVSSSEWAADSLRVLRTADPCAMGPSKVRSEVRPGESRPAPQADA
jgi:hypothetical protein